MLNKVRFIRAKNSLIQIIHSINWHKGAFNKYVDQILPDFDPLPPGVDNCGHFT